MKFRGAKRHARTYPLSHFDGLYRLTITGFAKACDMRHPRKIGNLSNEMRDDLITGDWNVERDRAGNGKGGRRNGGKSEG